MMFWSSRLYVSFLRTLGVLSDAVAAVCALIEAALRFPESPNWLWGAAMMGLQSGRVRLDGQHTLDMHKFPHSLQHV
jgi:hypothetical protein